jgi:heat shock protein HslJ
MILRFGSMALSAGLAAALAACVPVFPSSTHAPLSTLYGTSWVLESGSPIPAQPAPAPAAESGPDYPEVPGAKFSPATPAGPTPWLLPDRGSRPTLRFSADQSSAAGSTGCNTYFGDTFTGPSQLTFGTLATTKMMCFDTLAVQEIQYLDLLSRVRGYQHSAAQLVLTTGDGRQLVFTPLSNPVGAQAATYNYVCDDGLYFTASYDPATASAAIKLSTGAADALRQEAAGAAMVYGSQRHRLHAKGNEALLETLYDGGQHRCKAPLAPQG